MCLSVRWVELSWVECGWILDISIYPRIRQPLFTNSGNFVGFAFCDFIAFLSSFSVREVGCVKCSVILWPFLSGLCKTKGEKTHEKAQNKKTKKKQKCWKEELTWIQIYDTNICKYVGLDWFGHSFFGIDTLMCWWMESSLKLSMLLLGFKLHVLCCHIHWWASIYHTSLSKSFFLLFVTQN